MSVTTGPVIAVRGLTKVFGDRRAVDDLSFEVAGGRVTGFLGPNGAGKTTTIRALLGLARPTAGTTSVLGRPYPSLDRPGRDVGVLIDPGVFHPKRTGRNHLRWMAGAARIDRTRIPTVLETVGLAEAADRRVGQYSMGMRQRLGLAAALLGDPSLLVLDEPANGLDPAGIRWLRDFLRTYAAGGGSVFVSSHQLAEMSLVADEVVVINRGRLVVHTSVHELVAGAAGGTRVRTPDPGRLRAALETAGAQVSETEGMLLVRGIPIERVGETAAAERIVLHELAPATQTLEDVFFELTREEPGAPG